MNTRSRNSQRPGLLHDRSGAMIVVGMFMAFFLAGGLFYIAGIGEALVFRQRVQDGADAIAYSAAGVHARGMNLIVMINLIMAALLAVLIFLKLVKVILIGITAALSALCASIIGAWVCPAVPIAKGAHSLVSAVIPPYEKAVNHFILPGLNFVQVGIALGTPWYATIKTGPDVADQYDPLVEGGTALSPSLMPQPAWDGSFQDLTAKDLFDMAYNGKLGLPVQQDSYNELCGRAAKNVSEIFTTFIPSPLDKAIDMFAGALVKSFPKAFCGAGSMNLDGFSIPYDDIAKGQCDKERDKKAKQYKDEHGTLVGFTFPMDACVEQKEKELKDQKDQTDEEIKKEEDAFKKGLDPSKFATPKKIFDGAEIGYAHFQVWSLANGDGEFPRRTDRGVAVSTSNPGAFQVDTSPFSEFRFAQAEFYWDSPGTWDDNKADSMWSMRWRARLRRVRVEIPSILEGLAGPIFDKAWGKLQSKVLGGMDGGTLTLLLGGTTELIGKWIKDGVGFEFGPIKWKPEGWPSVVDAAGKGDDAINDAAQKWLATPEIIH